MPLTPRMDSILLPFLDATREPERERLLSELILVHAAPLVRHTFRQRLGFYLSPAGTNPHNPEAEDLYQDVLTKLVQRLNEFKAHPDQETINNFRQYVTSVATNRCHDYLRAKSPARARLKNSLRDLLDRHPDFALWKSDPHDSLCGFSAWRHRTVSPSSSRSIKQLEERPELFKEAKFPREVIGHVPLARVVAEIFEWVNSPIGIDDLVNTLAVLLEIKDHPVESLDDADHYWTQQIIDSTVRLEHVWEAREILQRLWKEIRRLPPKQRDTFCLSFEDASGDDLFSLLLDAEIVTWPEIATALDLSLKRLMTLWGHMPMDPAAIAAELGATRPQVNKWRFRALQQLEQQITMSKTRE